MNLSRNIKGKSHNNPFLSIENLLNSFKLKLKFVKNYSDNTVKSYERDIRQFFAFIHVNYEIEDIGQVTEDIILDYLHFLLKEEANKKNSVNRKISSLRHFFQFLIKEKAVSSNPLSDISLQKADKKLPEYLNFDEMYNLLNIDEKDKDNEKSLRNNAILELLYSTGMRVSELVALNVEDINFKENYIKIFGKGQKERIVIINNISGEKLKRYIGLRKKPVKEKISRKYVTPLFTNLRGGRLTVRGVQLIIKDVSAERGIHKKVTPHIIRHSFATHLLNSGMDIRMIQELLGHSSLSTTQKYTHVGIEKLMSTYDKSHPKSGKFTCSGEPFNE